MIKSAFPGGPKRPVLRERTWRFFTDEELTEFVATAVNSGTSAIADDIVGGGLVLSGAATTDDSGANVQLDAFPVKLAAGKSARFLTTLKLSDATQSDLMVGFGTVDTSIIAGSNDFVGFKKTDGSKALQAYYVRDGGTAETLACGDMADDTEVTLAFESTMDSAGGGFTAFYVDGVCIGKITHTTTHLGENNNAPAIAFQSGDATGTKTCTVKTLWFGLD